MAVQPPSSQWRFALPWGRGEGHGAAIFPAIGRANVGALLDVTGEMGFALTADLRILCMNRAARGEFGLEREAVGCRLADILPDLERGPLPHALLRALGGHPDTAVEVRFKTQGRSYSAKIAPVENGLIVLFRNTAYRDDLEAELYQRSRSLRALLDSVPEMIWSHAADGRYEYYNRTWRDFTGMDVGGLRAGRRIDLVHPDDAARAQAIWEHSLATGEPYECEYRMRHRSGGYRWVVSRGRARRNAQGRIVRWYGTCTDIHQQVLDRESLNASELLVRSIIEASADSIKMLDSRGILLFVNRAARRMLRTLAPIEPIGGDWIEGFPEEERDAARDALIAAQTGGKGQFVAALPGEDDRPRWWDIVVTPVHDAAGAPERLVVISRDISDQKQVEERIRWSATHDALTMLPNRASFQETLDRSILKAQDERRMLGLMLLDLNDFKLINDTLGHDAGDAILCSFADRLRRTARPDDFVVRLGGDEFAIIMDRIANKAEVAVLGYDLLKRLREPYLYDRRLIDCQASIGATLYPDQGRTAAELLKQADVALYASKALGAGQIMLFEPRMRAEMQHRASMLSVARVALKDQLIRPHYQPKVEMKSRRITGFEALLRWEHPTQGIQLPATLAAAFDDLELAAAISDRMVDRVVKDIRRWLDAGVAFGHVAVNASAAEFHRGGFADRLLDRLHHAGVPPQWLQVEVTETVFLGRGAECVEQALTQLSRAGIIIALDDFGTGYASLSHLKQFPVRLIKIDKSFIGDIKADPSNAAIIRAVIGLGHSLEMQIVAEGIEVESQHEFLSSLGCDFGQGFLYGKAAPADRVPEMIVAARSAGG